MKLKKLLIIFSFLVLLFGCATSVMNPDPPPYVISKPVCTVGAKEQYYNFAGIDFTISNTAKKDIQYVIIKCTVYDADTKTNPLIGSNQLVFKSALSILSGNMQTIVLSLDPFIFVAPKTPYLIDFLYIASITYSDGSTWEDTNGTYYSRSY